MNEYTLCSRCNEKPAAICISCLTDCTESLKQQPPASEIIALLEKALKRLEQYREPPVIRISEHPLKYVYDSINQALDIIDSSEASKADLLTAIKQIQTLNAGKDCDIKWLCEQTIAKAKKE